MTKDSMSKPDCMKCFHFYVTWDPAFPRGCRAYGFKGKRIPSLVVLAESGTPCQYFQPKPPPERGGGQGSR